MARPLLSCLLVCWVFATATSATADDAAAKTIARIDAVLERSWQEAGVKPAPRSSDAEFLRRIYLDLTGVIPPIGGAWGVRAFLADKRPDRRLRLIEALLKKPNHATHLTNVWRDVMTPQSGNQRNRNGAFEVWLRGNFADNTPYDRMVAELLTASGQRNQSGPVFYYTSLQVKPEELAASTSRIFLGVQIQCAQCHDHPFDHWTRKDFWGYAAFFAQVKGPRRGQGGVFAISDAKTGEVKLPGTKTVIAPRYLGGKAAAPRGAKTRREQVAAWLTSKTNPYFARATVNRAWAMMFGRGLVDPVDDFGKHNPPSHPELLTLLSNDFAASGFNLRRLFRIIAGTRAYQLSSENVAGVTPTSHLFNRMALKSLTAEQIYDCLSRATLRRDTEPPIFGRLDRNKAAFLAKFTAPTQGATELQTGIPQILTMMNGPTVARLTDLKTGQLLTVLLDSPFVTDNAERVETLFLSTLSRPPRKDERARFVKYVCSGGRTQNPRQALTDVLWALVNSAEFVLNH